MTKEFRKDAGLGFWGFIRSNNKCDCIFHVVVVPFGSKACSASVGGLAALQVKNFNFKFWTTVGGTGLSCHKISI